MQQDSFVFDKKRNDFFANHPIQRIGNKGIYLEDRRPQFDFQKGLVQSLFNKTTGLTIQKKPTIDSLSSKLNAFKTNSIHQLKAVNINNDKSLEKEADVMGARALKPIAKNAPIQMKMPNNLVIQRVVEEEFGTNNKNRYFSTYHRQIEPGDKRLYTKEEAEKLDKEYKKILRDKNARRSTIGASSSSIPASTISNSLVANSSASSSIGTVEKGIKKPEKEKAAIATSSQSSVSMEASFMEPTPSLSAKKSVKSEAEKELASESSASSAASSIDPVHNVTVKSTEKAEFKIDDSASSSSAAPSSLTKETHLAKITEESARASKQKETKTYNDAGDVFRENVVKYKHLLNEKAAKKAGYSGIIHFGFNSTIEGSVGVAGKPHAVKAYKGKELTFANTQEMIKLMQNDASMKEATSNVRKVNNAPISAARLEMALRNSELIYFHLNQFTPEIISALIRNDDTFSIGKFVPVDSVTGQEFIHIHTNWGRFSKFVVFLKNLAPVPRPW